MTATRSQLGKADLAVRVVDRDRQPVEGAGVRVRMKRHAFGFGSAVRANWLCMDSEDGREYRQRVEQNYNKVRCSGNGGPMKQARPGETVSVRPAASWAITRSL